jgi:hypothetical protein
MQSNVYNLNSKSDGSDKRLRFNLLFYSNIAEPVLRPKISLRFAFAVSPPIRCIDLAIPAKMGPMNPPFVGKRQFERKWKVQVEEYHAKVARPVALL